MVPCRQAGSVSLSAWSLAPVSSPAALWRPSGASAGRVFVSVMRPMPCIAGIAWADREMLYPQAQLGEASAKLSSVSTSWPS
jgi:hypothetical protein